MKKKFKFIFLIILFPNYLCAQTPQVEIDSYLKTIKNNTLRNNLTGFLHGSIQKKINTNGMSTNAIHDSALWYLCFKRYCRAGSKGYGKVGLDCSGLVKAVYGKIGITMDGGAQNQAQYGTLILDKRQLKRGDLLYFTNTYKAGKGIFITHTGIVLSDSTWIHSCSRGVVIDDFNAEYYFKKGRYLFATRIINDEMIQLPTLEFDLFKEIGIEINRQQ